MTGAELRRKYRLLKLATEEGARSYQALDEAGHMCMVHLLPAGSPETDRLLTLLDGLSAADQARIVERLDVDGAPVVVTQLLSGFETLAAWLRSLALRPRGGAQPPASSRGVGEFTQMFGPGTTDAASQPTDHARPVEPPPPAPVSTRPAPGGLTQLFGPMGGAQPASRDAPPSSASPPSPPAPSPRPIDPAQPANRARAAEDLTQLFGPGADDSTLPLPRSAPSDRVPPETAQPPGGGPPPPTPRSGDKPSVRWREPSPAAEPGSRPPDRPVVRWNKESRSEAPDGRAGPPPPPTPPAEPRAKPPGELTQLFGGAGSGQDDRAASLPAPTTPSQGNVWDLGGGVAAPVPPVPSPPPTPGIVPGEFTRLFQPDQNLGLRGPASPARGAPDLVQALKAPSAPVTPPGPPAPPVPPASAPGEFTRLMQGVAPPRDPGIGSRAPSSSRGAPGDFTRIVAGVSAPLPPAPGAVPAAGTEAAEPASPGRSPRLIGLVVALGLVVLAAAALVLFFALK